MVPFSFKSDASYSRGMNKSIYTLRPGAMGPEDDAAVAGLLNNGVQRHAGWVHGVDHRPSRWWPVRCAPGATLAPTSPLCRLGFEAVLKGFKVI